MRRIIITVLIALTALGGVASADRDRRDHRSHGGVRVDRSDPRPAYRSRQPRVVRPTYRSTYRPTYRSTYRPHVNVVRRPIYVQRPVIRYRYYNHYQRPAVIVENYPSMTGYLWVAGQWQWNGYEWIWQPGHYEPDPAYQPYPDAPYNDGSYYNNY
jgi:hypothetical protein